MGKTSKIGPKIKLLRKSRRYSQDKLAEELSITGSQVGNYERGENEVPQEILVKLASLFDVSIGNLVDDKLELELTSDGLSVSEPPSIFKAHSKALKAKPAGMIPFYDTMATAGSDLIKADDAAVLINDYELINPGHFFGKATGALRLYGDSMYEKYPSGSIIAYRESKDWRSLIHFGQDYVIETKDGHRVVKNIQPSDREGYILAVSYNTYKNKHGIEIYRPYPIPIDMIRQMAYVLGMIKFEASL